MQKILHSLVTYPDEVYETALLCGALSSDGPITIQDDSLSGKRVMRGVSIVMLPVMIHLIPIVSGNSVGAGGEASLRLRK
jgi:hypothetical protein